MGELLRASLAHAPVVKFGTYDYFVHPLTDGVPAIDPRLLAEVVQEITRVADLHVDKIVTAEAMGIPLATALSLHAGLPFVILRKRKYGLPGEVEIGQKTGYSKGSLYVNGLTAGDQVLFVDDVISTGGTLGPVLDALRRMDVHVRDVVIVFEKGDGRADVEKRYGVHVKTLQKIEIRDGRVVPT